MINMVHEDAQVHGIWSGEGERQRRRLWSPLETPLPPELGGVLCAEKKKQKRGFSYISGER